MKTFKYYITLALFSLIIISCNDDWDAHYGLEESEVDNQNISFVNTSAKDYISTNKDLSSFYSMMKETGVIDAMNDEEQLFTVLVVGNENYDTEALPQGVSMEFIAKSHISDIALSPANLTNGQRILMWNGKYASIYLNDANDNSQAILFNESMVDEIIKVNDGYIYKLKSFLNTPKSMYEIIEELGDDYSIFRDQILSKNQRIFDKEASLPIGVDNTGSTVYDSVFVVTNPYFNAKNFDLMSELLSATMLIPSNDVINDAISEAKSNLNIWGIERADSILSNWAFQSMFFDKQFFKEDFQTNEDLTSIFGSQWRTTVQNVDLDHPVSMSNGMAYYVKKLKIPTNVLIYRIKDFFKWYEFLSEEDKDKYYVTENLSFREVKTDVEAWSGWPAGGFPEIENRVIYYNFEDRDLGEFKLDFTPYIFKKNTDGSYTARAYKVPPGEYDLCLGFKQNLGHDVEISFNGKFVRKITTSELTSTTFHYDRGGQGYPEGYDVNKATNRRKGNYDRDGGRAGIVTIDGDEAVEISITFRGVNLGTRTNTMFHHWCLKPTKNCY